MERRHRALPYRARAVLTLAQARDLGFAGGETVLAGSASETLMKEEELIALPGSPRSQPSAPGHSLSFRPGLAPVPQAISLIETYCGCKQANSYQNHVTSLDVRRTKNVLNAEAERDQAKNADEQHQCEPCPIVRRIEVNVTPSPRAANPVRGTFVVGVGWLLHLDNIALWTSPPQMPRRMPVRHVTMGA